MSLQHHTGDAIRDLIILLARLPGLGPKSAQRLAIHLMKQTDKMTLLMQAFDKILQHVKQCSRCHALDTQDPCSICSNPKRRHHIICIVENVDDLWSFEKAAIFDGSYHVLGGALSSLDAITPDQLTINSLAERIATAQRHGTPIEEIIIATSATIGGQITAHYIAEAMASFNIGITRLANGIPIGGELHYLDERTLAAALQSRTRFDP